MRRYYILVTLTGKFSNADECESFIEDGEWYLQESEEAQKKIVPLFPYLRKMVIHQHHFFGCVVGSDVIEGKEKVFRSQVILEVSGFNGDEVRREILDGDWLRANCGLTVIPPTYFITGYEDKVLSSIEWDIRSGETTNSLDMI